MAATDDFASLATGLDGPLVHLVNVTPDDANDLAHVTRAVYIGAAGALKVTTVGGETITIPSAVLGAGVAHKMRVTRIWATGTTATPIMAAW